MPNQFHAVIYEDRLIGTLHAIEREEGVQIGFSILPKYKALELDRKALQFLLKELSGSKCYFDLHHENRHSISIVESLGFQKKEQITPSRSRWRMHESH